MKDLPFDREQLIKDLSTKTEIEYLVLFDIDNFASVNHTYSNQIGNKVLNLMGDRILNYFFLSSIYRMGDRFAILIDNTIQKNSLKHLILSFLFETKTNLIEIENHKIYISLSVGLSNTNLKGDLLVNAEIALKVARLRSVDLLFFKEEMNLNKKLNHQMHKITQAILLGEIIPYYQPIVDNISTLIVKYEALARLFYKNELIFPDEFIPISKKTKLYNQITIKMIKQIFKDFENINKEVSINLSVEDIADENVAKLIKDECILYSGLNRVIFEITEIGHIEDYDKVNEFINDLKALGTKFSIDDFGTGHSNFEHLLKLSNIDYIKIDGKFIENINLEKNRQIVESILEISKKLGIKTIAEYVENEETYSLLTNLGVDFSQGYYFGKPEPFSLNM